MTKDFGVFARITPLCIFYNIYIFGRACVPWQKYAASRRRAAWPMFLSHFDVHCALLEYSRTAKGNICFIHCFNIVTIFPRKIRNVLLRWLPRVSTKVNIQTSKSYKRNPSSVVLQTLFLRFASNWLTTWLPLFFSSCFLGIGGRCHGNKTSKEWRTFYINSSLFFNNLIFPRWNFLKLFYLVKMIVTNILQREKYGVVQTVSPISRDFLSSTIKLNWSDRIFPRNSMWKVALVSQNVQTLKKFTEGNTRKFTVNFAFFGHADVTVIIIM